MIPIRNYIRATLKHRFSIVPQLFPYRQKCLVSLHKIVNGYNFCKDDNDFFIQKKKKNKSNVQHNNDRFFKATKRCFTCTCIDRELLIDDDESIDILNVVNTIYI